MPNIHVLGFADPISSWSHLLMALGSMVAGGFLLYRGRGNSGRMWALGIYVFSLIFLFSMSGVFHLLDRETSAREILQRLDHAGIWVLIAGTFTPIHTILFRGPSRWLVLLLVWTIAITGLVLEIVFFSTFPEWLALTLFLGLGWIGAVSYFKFRKNFPQESFTLMSIGGVCYSIGALLDFMRWPVLWSGVLGPHEIFHLFVNLAAISQFLFIYRWANHPIGNRIICEVRSYPEGLHVLSAVNEHMLISSASKEEVKSKALQEISRRFRRTEECEVIFRYHNEEKITARAEERS